MQRLLLPVAPRLATLRVYIHGEIQECGPSKASEQAPAADTVCSFSPLPSSAQDPGLMQVSPFSLKQHCAHQDAGLSPQGMNYY